MLRKRKKVTKKNQRWQIRRRKSDSENSKKKTEEERYRLDACEGKGQRGRKWGVKPGVQGKNRERRSLKYIPGKGITSKKSHACTGGHGGG